VAHTVDSEVSDQDALVLGSIADSMRSTFKTVEDMARGFIREAIIQGVFRPGQRLNLDTIAETLGVSRMPVRASLKQLENEGLVQINHYRGATVAVLRPDEIVEIYELRILLESYLLRLAIKSLDDELLVRLEEIVAELENSEDLNLRLERRYQMYEELYRRANRPLALAQVNKLRSAVGRYLLLQRVDELHTHEELIKSVRARDAEAAVDWLTRHFSTVSAKLQELAAGDQEAALALLTPPRACRLRP
jgi:DNA-binding GntR family transcriptional regulator